MREFIDGATAIARAALDAGCDFFAGYPISPATPLLLHMIRELPKRGGVAIQAEDEIASISMCIGATMTGARTPTATSGPGRAMKAPSVAAQRRCFARS
jgi:2-oxoglutarate ferredoxin oxidoreductase subunit alpha